MVTSGGGSLAACPGGHTNARPTHRAVIVTNDRADLRCSMLHPAMISGPPSQGLTSRPMRLRFVFCGHLRRARGKHAPHDGRRQIEFRTRPLLNRASGHNPAFAVVRSARKPLGLAGRWVMQSKAAVHIYELLRTQWPPQGRNAFVSSVAPQSIWRWVRLASRGPSPVAAWRGRCPPPR